jgi:type II secretory pathway pseudopilin PulG
VSKRGFTLTELLMLGAAITLIGVLAMPTAYAARRDLNEEQVRGYLRMIHGAQLVWRAEVGDYQRLGYMVLNPPPRRVVTGPNLRVPLLPTGFLPYLEDDVGRRSGYRFESGYTWAAGPAGCWAWPESVGYAGNDVYWLEYASGTLYVVDEEPNWRELSALPVPDEVTLTPFTE